MSSDQPDPWPADAPQPPIPHPAIAHLARADLHLRTQLGLLQAKLARAQDQLASLAQAATSPPPPPPSEPDAAALAHLQARINELTRQLEAAQHEILQLQQALQTRDRQINELLASRARKWLIRLGIARKASFEQPT